MRYQSNSGRVIRVLLIRAGTGSRLMSLVYSDERIFILNSPRDIRLYPNRRLYDPVVARYIKYDDILALVRNGIPFTIKETARGKDQTHKVFTDLIIREELAGSGAEQAFTKGFLLELIRLGATQSAPLAAAFLNYSINTLMQAESEGTPRSKDR